MELGELTEPDWSRVLAASPSSRKTIGFLSRGKPATRYPNRFFNRVMYFYPVRNQVKKSVGALGKHGLGNPGSDSSALVRFVLNQASKEFPPDVDVCLGSARVVLTGI
jgi:hypothetical protein